MFNKLEPGRPSFAESKQNDCFFKNVFRYDCEFEENIKISFSGGPAILLRYSKILNACITKFSIAPSSIQIVALIFQDMIITRDTLHLQNSRIETITL